MHIHTIRFSERLMQRMLRVSKLILEYCCCESWCATCIWKVGQIEHFCTAGQGEIKFSVIHLFIYLLIVNITYNKD